MRVLFINHSATASGAPFILLELLNWLKRESLIEIDVLSRQPGVLLPQFQAFSAAPMDVRRDHGRFASLRQLLSFSSKRHGTTDARFDMCCDLIYSNTITNGAFVESLNLDVPVVTHVHELEYWIEKSGRANIECVKKQTNHFIAASNAVRNNLILNHGIPPDKITVIHEFIRTPEPTMECNDQRKVQLYAELSIDANDFVVCCSGWEFWRKGRDLVPQLLQELHKRIASERKVHLLWVGTRGTADEEFALRFDLERMGLDRFFHNVGHVQNPLDYFIISHLFALLSRDDPFPLVCLENAILGNPIICFAGAGGMPEFVGNGCGIVVPYLDLPAMADAIDSLLGDLSRRDAIGQYARREVLARYTIDVAGPQILKLMHSVAANG